MDIAPHPSFSVFGIIINGVVLPHFVSAERSKKQ
jgi:hypothetical protein